MSKAADQKLPIIKWIFLLVAPIAALFLIAILQFVVHFVFTSTTNASGVGVVSSSPALDVVNILSVLIGITAVASLCLTPLWIIMLVKTINHNDATEGHVLNKTAAIIFAVCFGFWAWVYTYERDKSKFWLNFGLTIITIGFWGTVAWIWAIVNLASKSDEFYDQYPNYDA